MATCMLTGKRPTAINNKPKSLHKTRRMVKPNIQKFRGLKASTRAIRTIKRQERLLMEAMAATAQPQA